ncbi:MAG: DALR domain-containing protein [Actinomycetota bacterium]
MLDEISHLEKEISNLRTNFEDAMDDDFNTAKALSYIFKFSRELNKVVHLQSFKLTPEIKQILIKAKNIIIELASVLGLDLRICISGTIKAVSKVDGSLTYEKKLEDELNNIASKIYEKVVKIYPQDAAKLSPSNISKLNLEDSIEVILSLRSKAREKKNWVFADNIRKKLKEIGISIKDTPSGTKWRFS